MIEAAAQEVLRLMPMEWESLLTNLATVHADVPRIVEEIDCCSALVRDGIDLDFLKLVRLNMVCHLLTCVGLQEFLAPAGPTVVKLRYLQVIPRNVFLKLQEIVQLALSVTLSSGPGGGSGQQDKPKTMPQVFRDYWELAKESSEGKKTTEPARPIFLELMTAIGTQIWDLHMKCYSANA